MSNFRNVLAARWLFVGLALVLLQTRVAAQADFRRGDVNVDGVVDIADAYFISAYLFQWLHR